LPEKRELARLDFKEDNPSLLKARNRVIALASQPKAETSKPEPFRFDWAGALSRYKYQFTSVELHKQASRWRTESWSMGNQVVC